ERDCEGITKGSEEWQLLGANGKITSQSDASSWHGLGQTFRSLSGCSGSALLKQSRSTLFHKTVCRLWIISLELSSWRILSLLFWTRRVEVRMFILSLVARSGGAKS